jgi:hypothetical protein
MICRNRDPRSLFSRCVCSSDNAAGNPRQHAGRPGFPSCHVENKGCGGHLGCRQHAGGRPGSVATGCAVASSPEEVRNSPSPTAALPSPTASDPHSPHRITADHPGAHRATSRPPSAREGCTVNGSHVLRHAARAVGGRMAAVVVSVTAAGPALAQSAPQPPSLNQVLDAATAWLVGLLASLATCSCRWSSVPARAGPPGCRMAGHWRAHVVIMPGLGWVGRTAPGSRRRGAGRR